MDNGCINVIDFGLAKEFRDPGTYLHIPYTENNGLIGTVRYCSVNSHLGVEHAHCDNLESLAYILIYFLHGSLPWQSLETVSKKYKHERIMEKKQSTPIDVLCHGLPEEFTIFLNYARALPFDTKPDYSYIWKLFCNLSVQHGYQYDHMFDWNIPQSGIPEGSTNGMHKERNERVRKVKEPCASDRR